jgi:hypothetical protein
VSTDCPGISSRISSQTQTLELDYIDSQSLGIDEEDLLQGGDATVVRLKVEEPDGVRLAQKGANRLSKFKIALPAMSFSKHFSNKMLIFMTFDLGVLIP